MSNAPLKVVRSEITKILTLRSTTLTIAVTIAGTIALGYVYARSTRTLHLADDAAVVAAFTPDSLGLYATTYGQIGIIVLGALATGSEYSSGQIRASLAAVPHRARFLASKTVAFVLVALATAIPMVVLSYLAAQLALGEHGQVSMATGDLPGRLAGAVTYLVLMGTLAFAAGILTRSIVAPMVTLIALSQAISTVLAQMADPLADLAKYLPDLAGKLMFTDSPSRDLLSPAAGGLVLAAWVAALLLSGLLVLNKRDA